MSSHFLMLCTVKEAFAAALLIGLPMKRPLSDGGEKGGGAAEAIIESSQERH
jgi:hypothetical protein